MARNVHALRPRKPARGRRIRTLLTLVSALTLALVGVVVSVPTVAQADNGLSLAKSSGTVLLGGTADFTLTAKNSSGSTQYNLSFSDVLPAGATYKPGSTTPASYGEPTITVVDDGHGVTHQVLVWSNVADIAGNGTVTLHYGVQAPADTFPLNSTIPNSATAATNTNPYTVPDFNADGTVKSGTATATAGAGSAPTVSAVKITKDADPSEGELLRGVGDHQATYTLTVTNNVSTAVYNAEVVDYLPAALEFLGCGDATISPAEYSGAHTTVKTVAGCAKPASVETVQNPAGYPAGVYTKVTWNLGTLAPGQVVKLPYAAGIPLRANTTTFTGGTPGITGAQTANLNNNNGASVRETGTEVALKNSATVTANFGSAGGDVVSDTDSNTVTAEDLKVVKSASTDAFVQGEVVTYTLTINTSEYVETAGLTVKDVLPAGLCPQGATSGGNYQDCDPTAGSAPGSPNATFTAIPDGNGSYTLTFSPSRTSLAHNDQLVITYNAKARIDYSGSDNPTSAMDSFTNNVEISGVTTPRTGIGSTETGTQTVYDTSSWTLSASGPQLHKLRQENNTASAQQTDCPDGGYTDAPSKAETPYRLGDRVCYLLTVHFSDAADTRGASLTDFLPSSVTYDPAHTRVLTGANLLASGTNPTVSADQRAVTWTFANTVPKSRDFAVVVAATVTTAVVAAESAPAVEKSNLAKFRFNNSAGAGQALRDSIDAPFGPSAPIGLDKSVAKINGDTGKTGPQVQAGDTVTYSVKLTNDSTDTTAYSDMSGIVVWDALPDGLTCAQVGNVSDGGACDPATNRIAWTVGTAEAPLAHGASRSLTYDVKIPDGVSVSTTYTNHAGVVSYQTPTNVTGGFSTHYPANNINPAVDPKLIDVPAADDTATVNTANAAVTKTNTTTVTGNHQAVVGEIVNYTATVKIPARTSVYDGVFSDNLPAGFDFAGPLTVRYSPDAGTTWSNTLPPGASLGTWPASILTFGESYTNTTGTDQWFEVTVPVRVNKNAANLSTASPSWQQWTNTATFKSNYSHGGSPVTDRAATSTVTVIQPTPKLVKSSSPSDTVVGGQVVTYTLVASNTAGSTLQNPTVIDCIPVGLTFTSYQNPAAGLTPEAGNGSNGCATDFTRIGWNLSALASGASATITYTATVTSIPAGAATYTNLATLTGYTLDESKDPGHTNSRQLSTGASHTVAVSGADITKTAAQPTLAPGQQGSWTITVGLPANVAFYDSAVMDVLPAGISPGSVTNAVTTCTYADATAGPCTLPAGAGTALGISGQNYGWLIGDVGTETRPRTVTITYQATLSAATGSGTAGNAKQNVASYRWNLTDGANPTTADPAWGTAGKQASATINVVEPSLSLTKSVASTTPAPGDTFTYTVRFTNANTTWISTAYNITLTDVVPSWVKINQSSLPAGATLAGADLTTGGGGTITFPTTASLAKNGSVTYTYTAKLIDSQYLANTGTNAQVQNTATIGSYSSLATDGRTYGPVNRTATVTPQFPKVTNAKAVASGPAYVGQAKQWTITLTNTGGAVAKSATITDVLPKNWLYQASSATITVAGVAQSLSDAANLTATVTGGVQTLVWTTPYDIPATGANKTIVLTFSAIPQEGALTDPGAGSTHLHTNTVTSTVTDATGKTANASGSYSGAQGTASTHIDSADLRIVKTSDHNAVAGGTLTYTLTVTNLAGSDQAVGGFTVTDTLPPGLGTVSASGSGWSCSPATTTITCSRNGTLNAGASFPDITVTAAIPSSTDAADPAHATVLTNSATVSGTTYDPNLANNTSTVADTVSRSVDVQIVKAVSSSPVVAGQTLTYTLNVKNNGPSDSASGTFTVSDDLPAGLSYVSATGTDWSCSETPAGSDKIACTTTAAPAVNGTLPTITVTAKVAASASGKISNTATVTGPEPLLDPNTGNNSSTAEVTPTTSADLALIKKNSTGEDDWIAGGTGTYTFTVLNYGTSDAAAPKVVDTLPGSVTFVSGSTSGAHWSCSASGQTVTCNRDAALAGGTSDDPTSEQFSFQVTVAADLPAGTNIHNTATVSSTTDDPNQGNNTGTSDTNSTQRADLGITKSGPDTAVAGDGTISFGLQVHNYGESDVPAPVSGTIDPITVTDTLPAGMSYDSYSGTNWSCSASGQTVTCTLGVGLAAGANAPALTIKAAVASNVATGTLANYANVSGPLSDPKPSNNTDRKDVTITVEPSLTIAKTADPTTVRAGNEVTYTIVVKSTGPSDATNVELYDPLAAGLAFVSIDAPSGWTCSDTAADCTRPRLAAGATATFTVTARVGSGVADGESITNAATVTADGGLSKTADRTVDVVARADLSLAKSHPDTDQPILAGQSVTFTLKVHNNGPSDAQPDVKVVDTLPAGMTFAGSTGVWNCTAAGQVVTCVLPDGTVLLATQDAPSLQVTATVAADLDPATTKLTNAAEVSSGTTDPDPDNNTATDDVLIGYRADLSITKTHDPDAVRVGDPLAFTLQVSNAGPSVARNVVVTDTLPDALTYVSASGGADWTCSNTAQLVECAATADLAVGEAGAITVTATVTADAYPSVSNTAKVTSDTPDPDSSNNTSTDPVTVPPQVDLGITKSHEPEPLQVGDQATYTIGVSNAGNTDDPGPITVTDTLPAGLSYVSGGGDGWTCTAATAASDGTQEVTCTRATGLETTGNTSFQIVVMVGPQAYPGVTNTATVTSPAEDTNPSNNRVSDPATVLPLYDLAVTKTLDSITGSSADWTISVTNSGPNEAPGGAVVTDNLPNELSFVDYTGDGWTCAPVGQLVTCIYDQPIGVGETVAFRLHTAIDSGASGTVTNSATVEGGNTDSASGDIPSDPGNLAYTGGFAAGAGVLGLLLIGGGLLLVRARRRT